MTAAIIAFISAVLLARHNQFSGSILITNLAYEMALSVRQAQVYGLASRESPVGGGFTIGYGVHFESTNPTYFIFFADLNGNHRYDGGGELIERYDIRYGNQLSNLCATQSGGTVECSSSGAINYIDISFLRPNPDAFMRTSNFAGTYRSLQLSVVSPQGVTRSVSVYSTGQISVQ